MSHPSLGRFGLLLMSMLGAMALFSASAFAAGPPIVTVDPASNISLNTATTSGTVDSNGGTGTTYKVEYGKTKLYGKSTTAKSTGSGKVSVSQILVGLEPLTTYHFRISATNNLGTTVSEDKTFEMLLDWKVEGKYLSELPSSPVVVEEKSGANTPIAIQGTVAGVATKISCVGGPLVGVTLGSKYDLPFNNCVTYLNGNKSGACAPQTPSFHLHLNGFLATSETQYIYLGEEEECPIGEVFPLTGGFAIGAQPEGKVLKTTLAAEIPFGLTINYGPVGWSLSGPFVGQNFGIS